MASTQSDRWWDDDDFRDRLLALLVFDVVTLARCAAVLTPEDFRIIKSSEFGVARQIVAERALGHYKKHHEPLGLLLRADVLEYAGTYLSGTKLETVKKYIEFLKKVKPSAADAMIEKVIAFKEGVLQAAGVHELVELQAAGQLTPDKVREVTARMLATSHNNGIHRTDYRETFADRAERRANAAKHRRIPYTFIDPLDSMVRMIGPKQTGLVIAPYKRGKSMFLEWLALAYALQRIKVLYITAEDPQSVVEDRLDAIVTRIQINRLHEFPQHAQKRFAFKRELLARIDIYDATAEVLTNERIESIIAHAREEGVIYGAILTDYDEKIAPTRAHRDRRFEIDEVYQDYLRIVARNNYIGWLAAQTQRDTSHLKVLTGDRVAEDLGKARKVHVAVALGKGDWEEDSIYLYVAAHKTDRMAIGTHIVPDRSRGLIYDRDATDRLAKLHKDDE